MAAPGNRSLSALICALGIAQVISWGSFYYSIAVLGESMQRDLGISSSVLFGAFTFSLLMSGLAAPTVGRLIDERGGRRILSAGSIIGCLALLLLASAQGPVTLLIGSAASGIAMSVCLYEAVFITLNQVTGARYRTSVTAVTLFGGFASTAFWPLSQLLLELVGWRWTLLIYAGLQFAVCLPLHALVLPAHQQAPAPAAGAIEGASDVVPARGSRYNYLAIAFAIGSFVLSALSVHIIALFRQAGLSAGEAVLVATLIGPMQVLVRVLEFVLARNVGPVGIGAASFLLMVMATVALYFVDGYSALAFIAAGLYGFSNGIMTIIRGTVPAVLFGREGYGVLLGRLARPAFAARALAPFGFSAILTLGLMHGDAILLLTACSLVAGLAYFRAALVRTTKPA
ncbi:MFS transporter [Lacisediminimonas profundi]|uniref:MFS transporter n=1 Tax=Lacisediminimonas profundi TaxID=2603856 RepID=UPI00124BA1D3|nr:MFS transporter [Lacisediminimonas profundi]